MKNVILKTVIPFVLTFVFTQCKEKCDESEKLRYISITPMLVIPQTKEIRLGDTLRIQIEIPYNNKDQGRNIPINLGGSKISDFGLTLRLYNQLSGRMVIEGVDKFFIQIVKGVNRPFNEAGTRNDFAVEADKYVFEAKIVPLKKGLVNIVNARAEARMNKDCTLIDFNPVCINSPNNHDLYYDFSSFLGASDYVIPDNHYYVWVR